MQLHIGHPDQHLRQGGQLLHRQRPRAPGAHPQVLQGEAGPTGSQPTEFPLSACGWKICEVLSPSGWCFFCERCRTAVLFLGVQGYTTTQAACRCAGGVYRVRVYFFSPAGLSMRVLRWSAPVALCADSGATATIGSGVDRSMAHRKIFHHLCHL